MVDPLESYRELCQRVESFCRTVRERLGDRMACRKGCSSCCRPLTLFPVEAFALLRAVESLTDQERIGLGSRLDPERGDCPFLVDDACIVYESRPIICRTHGYPLTVRDGERRVVDHCPLNFRGVETLPGECVLDLGRLNLILVTINARFVENHPAPLPERISMHDLLMKGDLTSFFPTPADNDRNGH